MEYEGLHLLCANCGCYGHLLRQCTNESQTPQVVVPPPEQTKTAAGGSHAQERRQTNLGQEDGRADMARINADAEVPEPSQQTAVTDPIVTEISTDLGILDKDSKMRDSADVIPDVHGPWLTMSRKKPKPKPTNGKLQGPKTNMGKSQVKSKGRGNDPIFDGALAALKIREREIRSQGKPTKVMPKVPDTSTQTQEQQGKKRLRSSPRIIISEGGSSGLPQPQVGSSSNSVGSSALPPGPMDGVQSTTSAPDRPIMMDVEHIAGNHYQFAHEVMEHAMEMRQQDNASEGGLPQHTQLAPT